VRQPIPHLTIEIEEKIGATGDRGCRELRCAALSLATVAVADIASGDT